MFNLTANEITRLYMLCHGPIEVARESIHDWEMRMLDLLGPADCKFLIRSREKHLKGMWLMEGHAESGFFHPKINYAQKFDWGETAIRCTNNRRLEAVRIINQTEAIDSKENVILLQPALT